MSLQRVSYKSDLFGRRRENDLEWNQKSHNGEIPIATINMDITGEVDPHAVADNSVLYNSSANKSFIYEYIWDIGLTGRIGFDWLEKLDAEDALLVQIILKCNQYRFTSRVIFGTLEYLPPTRRLKDTSGILKKVCMGAGDVAKNAGFKTAGALSVLVSDIIPSNEDGETKWYLHQFDYPTDTKNSERAYGIEWHISRKLIQEIGSRFVGRLGIIFVDAPIQGQKLTGNDVIQLMGRFGLKLSGENGYWYGFSMLPSENSEKLTLKISPQP